MPILREAALKKAKRRPLGTYNNKDLYVAPLDRKTFEQRVKLR